MAMLCVVAVPEHEVLVLRFEVQGEHVLRAQCKACGWKSPNYPDNDLGTVKSGADTHAHAALAETGVVRWEWLLEGLGYEATFVGQSLDLAGFTPSFVETF